MFPHTLAHGRNVSQRLALAAVIILAFSSLCLAQRGGGGVMTRGSGSNVLWGDLKVDESKAGNEKPLSYTIILYTPSRTILDRTPISNGGRYRFLDLPDGEYDVAVEVDNIEVTRFHVVLSAQPSVGKSDTRRDIELEWRATGPAGRGPKAATISAEDLYKRTDANDKLFSRAQAATNEKKYDQAIATLRQLVEVDPQDFLAWTELGTNYLLKESFPEAENAYLRAAEARPGFFLAHLNLGRLYLLQKKPEKAIESLTQAIKIKADSADANYFLGEAYLQIKKGSLAVGYLNEAIRLDPQGKADVHLRLALLYNAAGMKDKAAAEYEQFLKKRPNYSDRKKLEQYITENKKQ
ncbi:MAG: tetratricopeptide repeat protein [Acidobacteriota bacterium]